MVSNVTLVRLAPYINSCQMHPQDILPPFGIAYVATVLEKRGIRILIIDSMAENISLDELARLINIHNSDLVIIDTYSYCEQIFSELCKILHSVVKAKIWCMGHFASTLPGILLKNRPDIGGCIIGEPEETVVDLVDYLNGNGDLENVKGIAFYSKNKQKVIITEKRDFINNLDKLPPINYDLLKLDKYKIFSAHMPFFSKVRWGFLLTSRGCHHSCIYCSPTLRQSYGVPFRVNSPRIVVEQMEGLIKKYNVNAIAFQDDNFTLDKERTIAICKEILRRKLRIKWVIQTRADCLDKETLHFLKKAGCVYIGIGVESGSDRILKILKKDEDKERISSSVREINDSGIFVIAFFMIGNPEETYSEMMETFEFAKELNPLMIQVAFFTPYPGSSFCETLKENKYLTDSTHHYNSLKYNFSKVSIEELIRFRNLFYFRYYLRPRNILRYLRYRAAYAIFNNSELKLLYKIFKYLIVGQKNSD